MTDKEFDDEIANPPWKHWEAIEMAEDIEVFLAEHGDDPYIQPLRVHARQLVLAIRQWGQEQMPK